MLRRYLALLGVRLKASLLLGMQYRADFLVDGAISMFWTVTALVPLFVIFGQRREVAGWSFGKALLVTGFFTLLEALLEGAINPSLTAVVENVRKGTLDFVLLKPADAQFLVSTSRFELWRSTNILTALVIFIYAFMKLGHPPSAVGVLSAGALLVTALLILYSLWILTVSAAFYVVKVDNLTYLFTSVFDAARWPVSIFRGVVKWVLTFIIPLAVMTTFPAQALVGEVTAGTWAIALGAAVGFFSLARWVWMRSLAQYTSASS
jgi:ABC-2 type transport system permease protein